jgi:hypothetical protein
MKRLNIAMLANQADQTQAEQIEEQQTELEVVGQQAEDAIAEATQIQAEIESTQQAADEAEEVVQEVEEERQVLEQAQEQGGAEPVAMEALQRAVARFQKRTGVACSVTGMGLESFSSKATRVQATKVAMEGAVEYIKKLIKMLTDAMAAVWEKVKAFVEKIMVGADRLGKRAKQIEAAAKAAQGKTAPADAVIKTGSVLAFARKDDKVVEGKAFADTYIKETSENYEGRVATKKAIEEFVKGEEPVKLLDLAAKADGKDALVAAAVAAQTPLGEGKVVDGLLTHEGERMLGEYAITQVTVAKDATWEQLSAGYSKVKTAVGRATDAKDDVVKEVAPMSAEDAKRVAYQAAGHMSSFAKMREEQVAIGNEIKKIVAKAKSLEKVKDAPVDQLRVATGMIRSVTSAAMGMMVSVRAYDVNLTKAALDYAAASVKAATGKGAESTGTQVAVV